MTLIFLSKLDALLIRTMSAKRRNKVAKATKAPEDMIASHLKQWNRLTHQWRPRGKVSQVLKKNPTQTS
jgi:hypothetical protein